MEKERYINTLHEVDDILKKDLQSDTNLYQTSESLARAIRNFAVKVLIIGEFSAGKTAMVNKLLGIDLLKEDITPETAIATELVFGETEGADLVTADGQIRHCSLAEAAEADPQKYLKYVYHLNNEVLKSLPEYVLVDMPGFNSGIEAHNKALLQYIGEGTAYLLVMTCEKGYFTQNDINFLAEIKNYSQDIGFILTKCDKKVEEDVEKVKSEVEESLASLMGSSSEVVTTSVEDEALSRKVQAEIHKFNPEQLFMERFDGDMVDYISRAIRALEISKEANAFNPSQIDYQIARRERIKTALEKQYAARKDGIQDKFKGPAVERIVAAVRTALMNNLGNLTSAAMTGTDTFQTTVNGIIRPVLFDTVKDVTTEFTEEAMDELSRISVEDVGGQLQSEEFMNYLHDMSESAVKGFKNLSDKAVRNLQIAGKRAGSRTGRLVFQTVATTAAVLTNVIAPILELIIIFLPDILSGIVKSLQRGKVESHIENTLIPTVCNEIRPKLQEEMGKMGASVMENIEKRFNEELDSQVQILQGLKETKAKEIERTQELAKNLERDIQTLQSLLPQFQAVNR